MSDTEEYGLESNELSPEQRLDPPNTRLINAGIATITDVDAI